MKLIATALVVLCGGQFVGAQQARWLGPLAPRIDTVEATMAYEPEGVTIRGAELGLVRQVRINDVPVMVVDNTGGMLVIEPGPQIPGFAQLELLSPRGTAAAEIEFMPSLRVCGSLDTLQVTLRAGEPGPYWVYYSMGLNPTPVAFPHAYHLALLDMTAHPCGLLASGFTCGPPMTLTFDVPPGFQYPIHFQAVCLYNSEPLSEEEWSFSNSARLEPTHAWPRSEAPPPRPTSR
jgi:hypothetical protein